MKRSFASDNNAPVHPLVMNALFNANQQDFVSYGDDPHTTEAVNLFRELLGADAEVFLVCTGTAANVSAISHLIRPWQGVLCAQTAHIQNDECGAPEKYSGSKLLTVPSADGKITPEALQPFFHSVGFEHHTQPGIISITQATELGMVYTPNEIELLARFAHQNDLFLHVDGARLANAAAFLNLSLQEIITLTGVDVISFGGTKNGLLMGEAVVFLNPELAHGFKYVRKQSMQLMSKMRYAAAQFVAHFTDDLWLKTAQHANQMAQLLKEKLADIPQISITRPVETNAVFAIIPKQVIKPLQDKYYFYVWNAQTNEVRWMTHFQTSEQDIEDFVGTIKRIL